jgi:nitrous oxidase accessory protein NosD
MFKRALVRVAVVAAVGIPSVSIWAGSAAASTLYVSAGQSWSQVLSQAAPGDTVVIRAGTYPRQTITQRFADTVHVVGESTTGVTVQGLNLTSGASHITFSGMTVTTASTSDGQSAIKVYGGSSFITMEKLVVSPLSHAGVEVQNWNGAPHDIRISDSTITGRFSSGTSTGRNVWIGDLNGGDATTWPTRIEVLRNDLGFATADAVHISGGTDVTVGGNEIHDVQSTDDHNDGVQSVASRGLRIVGNRISSPGGWTCTTCVPPDQGIIVGHAYPATTYKKVTQTYIADNIIHHWRGKGLMVLGTSDTRVVNNTVTMVGLPNTMTAASLTVAEPYAGYTNDGLRVWNNLVDRLAVAVTVPLAYLGHNCIRSGVAGEQAISADPRFTETTREFTLAPDSPCLAMGVQNSSLDTPAVDFAGVPLGEPADLGARQLERSGSPDSTTTSTTVAPTTTTTAPAGPTTTTTQPTWGGGVSTITELLTGSIGGRNGGSRTHTLSSGTGTLTGTLESGKTGVITVGLYRSDGTLVVSRQLSPGQSISSTVQSGPYRIVVSATDSTKYSLRVSHPVA